MIGLCWCACSCERCRSAAASQPRPGTSSTRPLSPPQTTTTTRTTPTTHGYEPKVQVQAEQQQQERMQQRDQQQQRCPKPPKNRRPPPPPLADGSPAPLPPPRPSLPLDGSVKTCLAVDRYQVLCDEVVVGGWKGKLNRLWCTVHEDEEKNVRTSFWNAVSSLPRLSRSNPLPSPSEITSCTSFPDLENWEQTCRQHIELAKRAFESWDYHRQHFGASEIDLVDRLEGRGEARDGTDLARGAWEEVRLRGEKAEAVLKLIIRRSHFLACDAEDALWLLHTDGCPHNHSSYSDCGGHGGGGYGTPGSSSDGDSRDGDEDDEDDEDDEEEEEEVDDEDEDSACSCCSHRSHSSTCGGDDHYQQQQQQQQQRGQQQNQHVSHHSHSHSHSHHSHSHTHHASHRSWLDSGEKPPHNPLRPPGSPTLAPENEEPDPLNALETLRRTELLELLSLTGSHASFIREGRKSVERVRIVECLFRRLISRDEELLVKAYRGGHDHVLRFFEDGQLVSLPALARLHHSLQRTSPTELKEAIMDAFRAIAWEESGATETEEGPEGVGMQVLGGWVYKNQLSRSMTPREWSHLYDLCACPGCAIRCCMRFTDLALIRRLTVIPHGPHPPPFELWSERQDSDARVIYKALDVVWCEGKEVDDEGKSRRMRLGGEKGREVWAIREERNWAFIKISIFHPYARSIIDLLSQHFTLVGRTRFTSSSSSEAAGGGGGGGNFARLEGIPLPHPHLLWTNRVRHAPTKAALSKPPPSPPLPHSSTISVATLAATPSPWRAYPNSFNCINSTSTSSNSNSQGREADDVEADEQDERARQEEEELILLRGFDSLNCPEKDQDLLPFGECFELLVLDAPVSSGFSEVEKYLARPLQSFECFLAGVLCQACGLKVPHLADDDDYNLASEKDILEELVRTALEHGAVESFLKGDLVWEFGDVRGVTSPHHNNTKLNGTISSSSSSSSSKKTKQVSSTGGEQQPFAGVDLKKVGKNGIVAPPLPPPGVVSNLPNGSKKIQPVVSSSAGATNVGTAAGKDGSSSKKEKVLEGLRDDKLALRLARSLFK